MFVESLPLAIAKKMSPLLGPFFDLKSAVDEKSKAAWHEYQNPSNRKVSSGGTRPRSVFEGVLQSDLPESEKEIVRLADEAVGLRYAPRL